MKACLYFYPDGKRITDEKVLQGKPWVTYCEPCRDKHFDKSKPITDIGRKVIAEHCTIPYPADTKTEALLKEMSQYGDVGKCCMCHKTILTSLFGDKVFSMQLPQKYDFNGTHFGTGISLYYPDKTPLDWNKDARYNDFKNTPHICKKCNPKHFEQNYDNPKRKHGTPLTPEAWNIATVPFPKT